MKFNRKGIALLWVVLTSALILVAILGISMKVVPQKKVENSRQYVQRALAVAETGLADVVYKLRSDAPVYVNGISTGKTIEDILQQSGSYDSRAVEYDSGLSSLTSTYDVRIQSSAAGYVLYSLGSIYRGSGPSAETESNVIARKAITVKYSGKFLIGDYGLFSGTSINVQNGTINGDVFANTSLTVKNGTINGTAYYNGSITGVAGTHVPEIIFPAVTIETYRTLWRAFLSGAYPYNGTGGADYPNTGSHVAYNGGYINVQGYLDTTLGTASDPAAQSKFETFLGDIQQPTAGTPAAYLAPFLAKGTLVFDITPASQGMGGGVYNSSPFLQGIVIIEGDWKITGNATIGVDPDKTAILKTAILVTGTVSVSGGGATINGLLYIDGVGKISGNPALSINATGGLAVNGSLVSRGGIFLNSNQLSVTWQPSEVYAKDIKTALDASQQSKISSVPSSWREISYDEFRNP